MAVDLKLQCERTELLIQGDTTCGVKLSNTGAAATDVLNPKFNPNMPVMRVIKMATGQEELHKRPGMFDGDFYEPLAQGGSIDHYFSLSERVSFSEAGEYEVSALISYDGGAREAESSPVRVKVQPVTPRNLSLAYMRGGIDSIRYGVAVNGATETPGIIRYELSPTLNVKQVDSVAPAPLNAKPVLSAPKNGAPWNSQWIAWQDGQVLKFTHFDPRAGALPVGTLPLPVPDAVIVPPLHVTVGEPGSRTPGAALLWIPAEGDRSPQLRAIELSVDGTASAGKGLVLPGPRPAWISSQVRSDGLRLAVYLQETGSGKLSLAVLPWPDRANEDTRPRVLGEWEGELVAADAAFDADDSLLGALVLNRQVVDDAGLFAIRFVIDRGGKMSETDNTRLDWPLSRGVASGSVRVGPGGTPAALLRDDQKRSYLYDGMGGITPVRPDLDVAGLPLELVFAGPGRPALLVPRIRQGYEVLMADGSPLPKL